MKGNFISEWFGHRVFPTVRASGDSVEQQQAETCPFLSAVKGITSACIKPQRSRGVCTVSTTAGGTRRDWLVCPYRALDSRLVDAAVQRLFGFQGAALIIPAIRLRDEPVRIEVANRLSAGDRVFIYFDEKLGGELGIPGTERSPEFSFDVTIIEVEVGTKAPSVGRFAVLEIQTMDFHGTYGHAVRNLKDTLRMFPEKFAPTVQGNQQLLSEKVEGPNIANVFKRTFYQMMFKFQLGGSDQCAGCALAIPQSVWDSWKPHLGNPALAAQGDGTMHLLKPGQACPSKVPAWIYVFDLNAEAEQTPSPIEIKTVIATDASSFSYHALDVAPAAALGNIATPNGMMPLLAKRLSKLWPELASTILIKGAVDELWRPEPKSRRPRAKRPAR